MNSPGDSKLLTVNEGSSSLKLAIYSLGNEEALLLEANVESIGSPASRITIKANGSVLNHRESLQDHGVALAAVLQRIDSRGQGSDFDGVGHRLVLGDSRFLEGQRIDGRLLSILEELTDSAPDHIPQLLDSIRTVSRFYPRVPQVVCPDSAFHSEMPRVATMFGLPRRFFQGGLRRYGFHGLSCEYVMRELADRDRAAAQGRIVIAHLGSGSSVTAVQRGTSIDTSMGFTPLAGLPMGSRSGDVDPGALVYLVNHEGMSTQELNELLNKQSGLVGVSEYSADMRDLLECEAADSRSADAIGLFCYQTKKLIGAYSAALGGLDIVVFTGGIGEHSAEIRQRICSGLEFLGITLDRASNAAHAPVISAGTGAVSVRVIKTNEDLMIARHTRRILAETM